MLSKSGCYAAGPGRPGIIPAARRGGRGPAIRRPSPAVTVTVGDSDSLARALAALCLGLASPFRYGRISAMSDFRAGRLPVTGTRPPQPGPLGSPGGSDNATAIIMIVIT